MSRSIRDISSRDELTATSDDDQVTTTVARGVGSLPTRFVRRTAVGVGIGGGAVCVAVVGCALMTLNTAAAAPADGAPAFWLMQLVGALAFGTVGGWLVTRAVGGLLGPLFVVIAVTQAVSLFGREYGIRGLHVADGLPGDRWLFWTSTWIWSVGLLVLFLCVPLVLPTGALLSRRWWAALAVASVTVVVNVVGWAVTPYDGLDVPIIDAAIGPSPLTVPVAVGDQIDLWALMLLGASAVIAVAGLVSRWRRTDLDERRATAWVLYGVALGAAFMLCAIATDVLAFSALAYATLPLACLVAITRHRLWDLQLVVRRSLVYGGLTALIAAAYAGVVGLVGGAVGAETGAPIMATAVVAMMVLPLHQILRRVVNRLVYGQAEDPYITTFRFGQRLGSAVTPDEMTRDVLPEIIGGVAQALRLTHLAIETTDGQVFAHGSAGSELVELPLQHGAEAVGTLRATPGRGGLTRSEQAALGDIAAQAAVAVHGVLLMDALRRERALVVSAREEERRRLRRELHDGVATAIAAACLQAETAQHLLTTQPQDAPPLISRLVEQLREAVVDVRAVTRDLRPVTLDELGLASALAELGARSAVPTRPVAVETGDLGEVPAAIEVAIYLVVAELVTNAVRHSHANQVQVRVHRDRDGLIARVCDNGIGMDADASPGLGLASVRRRIEELGGHLRIDSLGRGTTIEARLPLEPA